MAIRKIILSLFLVLGFSFAADTKSTFGNFYSSYGASYQLQEKQIYPITAPSPIPDDGEGMTSNSFLIGGKSIRELLDEHHRQRRAEQADVGNIISPHSFSYEEEPGNVGADEGQIQTSLAQTQELIPVQPTMELPGAHLNTPLSKEAELEALRQENKALEELLRKDVTDMKEMLVMIMQTQGIQFEQLEDGQFKLQGSLEGMMEKMKKWKADLALQNEHPLMRILRYFNVGIVFTKSVGAGLVTYYTISFVTGCFLAVIPAALCPPGLALIPIAMATGAGVLCLI